MKTVFFKKLSIAVFPLVYEPLEDSLLLAYSLHVHPKDRVLDIGCGTGIQGLVAALQGASQITFVDINSAALKNARYNVLKNARLFSPGAHFSFRKSDLFKYFSSDEQFDVVVFNPPYVPSEKIRWIETDGGKEGRWVLDRFLASIEKILARNGKFFFLQSSLNGWEKTKQVFVKKNFGFRVMARQKLFFEELWVICAWKKRGRKKKRVFFPPNRS